VVDLPPLVFVSFLVYSYSIVLSRCLHPNYTKALGSKENPKPGIGGSHLLRSGGSWFKVSLGK
jgi:hypothetical protein